MATMAARGTLRLALVLMLIVALAEASFRRPSASEDSTGPRDVQEFRAGKRSLEERKERKERKDTHRRWEQVPERESRVTTSRREREKKREEPPPINEVALMARYIVNQADWVSVATISSRKNTQSYPFVNLVALSDGLLGNGTGSLYLFLTPLDFTAQDYFKDDRATVMISLAQGSYCTTKKYDPMDPRCSRVVFSGKIKAINDDNPEFMMAKNAIFGRHPWLAHMPEDHHFFFAKLKINTIAVLDTFGGPKYVSMKEYYHPDSVVLEEYFSRHKARKSRSSSKILQTDATI